MLLYRRFKAERIAKGKTQEEVAKALGITRMAYMNKENGKTQFTLTELDKFNRYLEINDINIFFE